VVTILKSVVVFYTHTLLFLMNSDLSDKESLSAACLPKHSVGWKQLLCAGRNLIRKGTGISHCYLKRFTIVQNHNYFFSHYCYYQNTPGLDSSLRSRMTAVGCCRVDGKKGKRSMETGEKTKQHSGNTYQLVTFSIFRSSVYDLNLKVVTSR